jgi:aminopeptidase N
MAHSWFQAVLATNESLYEFMDEGMTSYATSLCMRHLFAEAITSGYAHRSSYSSYISQALSGNEEPLITHADHYQTNRAYGVAAYSKGEVLLAQLAAVMGPDTRDQGLRDYFAKWAFKHPGPLELKQCMEAASGLDLDWYFQYFINTTHTIDYAVQSVYESDNSATIELERVGAMPMPQNIAITFENGEVQRFHAPLVMMRGHKALGENETLLPDWPWTNPTYSFTVPTTSRIVSVELDADRQMADVNRDNNSVQFDAQWQRIYQRN